MPYSRQDSPPPHWNLRDSPFHPASWHCFSYFGTLGQNVQFSYISCMIHFWLDIFLVVCERCIHTIFAAVHVSSVSRAFWISEKSYSSMQVYWPPLSGLHQTSLAVHPWSPQTSDRCRLRFQALSHDFSAVYRMECKVKQHPHPVGFLTNSNNFASAKVCVFICVKFLRFSLNMQQYE